MKSIMLKITCITNMHVGSSNVSYSLVDNEVEKDSITKVPVIHASGVKGAFRQLMTDSKRYSKYVEQIFGTAKDRESSAMAQGTLKFLTAHLLLRPMRTTRGGKSFYLVTTEDILRQFAEMTSYFGNEKKMDFSESDYEQSEISVEGIKVKALTKSTMKKYEICEFANECTVMEETEYRNIDLPVLARNCLEEGKENLWYEEVVPHHSVFYSFVLSDGTEKGDDNLNQFKEFIKHNEMVQFGGNATIGYGLTKVEVVEGKDEQKQSR